MRDEPKRNEIFQLALIVVSIALLSATLWSWISLTLFPTALFFFGALAALDSAVRLSPKGQRFRDGFQIAITWVLFGFLFFLFIPIVWPSPRSGPHVACFSNTKAQAIAMLIYATDFDERLPLSASWNSATYPYTKAEFKCVSASSPWNYAMNSSLSGASTSEPGLSRCVLLFEADASLPNASGGPEWLVFRHESRTHLALASGQVLRQTHAEVAALRWKP